MCKYFRESGGDHGASQLGKGKSLVDAAGVNVKDQAGAGLALVDPEVLFQVKQVLHIGRRVLEGKLLHGGLGVPVAEAGGEALPNQLVFLHAHGSFCRFSLEYHTEEAKGKKKIESQAFSLGSRRRIFSRISTRGLAAASWAGMVQICRFCWSYRYQLLKPSWGLPRACQG